MTTSTVQIGLLVSLAGITAITAVVGLLALGLTWRTRRNRRRRASARDRVREPFLERLYSEDPDWDGMIEQLSRTERDQLRRLLDEYLRRLRGTEHDRLRTLARSLGIPAESKRDLQAGRDRFRALTWLTLLEEPIDVDRLRACCADQQRHRAGAARLLYESEHPEADSVGTELLVGDGTEPLSAFGMETLYRLNDGPRTPVLSQFPGDLEEWDQRLVVQLLTVLRYCSISESPEQFRWLLEALDHDSPRVRAAAVGVIERHGWRRPFQERIDVETLLTDPEPTVRYDVYQLLASWGSERSATWLRWALLDAEDDRERLAIVRALWSHSRASLPAATGELEPIVEWVQAEEAVGGRREYVWGVAAAWS